MKSLLTLAMAFCLLANTSHASTYYVSSSTGNDNNTAAQARNRATPWKSIAKLNSVMAIFKPGDNILFKTGDTFTIPEGINTGGLLVTVSGTAAAPITFGSYGTAAKPIITYPSITTWAAGASAGIYTSSFTIQSCCSLMYQDGVPLTKATTTALTDGDWFGTGGILYYKPTSGTPANHVLTVANINNSYIPGVDLSGRQYVTISGLQFNSLGVGIKTFETTAGTVGLTVQNCIFNYCQSGIFFMPNVGNNTNSIFSGNLFYRCQVGVRMYTVTAVGGSYATLTTGTHIGCVISNNEMSQCGTIDGTTRWQSSVAGTDFEAIGLQNFMGGTIANNYIHDGFCIGLSWYNLSTRNSDNNTIIGNTIMNNLKGGMILIGNANYTYGYNNNTFANNLFVNSNGLPGNGGGTIAIYQGTLTTVNSKFINNTLSGPLNNIAFENSNAPYFTIENNIVYNVGRYFFVTWKFRTKPASLTMDYNIYYSTSTATTYFAMAADKSLAQMQAMGLEMHSKIADPMFVNATANQYRLQSTSPAINTGTNVGLSYYGAGPDIGAYEVPTGTAVSAPLSAKAPKKP